MRDELTFAHFKYKRFICIPCECRGGKKSCYVGKSTPNSKRMKRNASVRKAVENIPRLIILHAGVRKATTMPAAFSNEEIWSTKAGVSHTTLSRLQPSLSPVESALWRQIETHSLPILSILIHISPSLFPNPSFPHCGVYCGDYGDYPIEIGMQTEFSRTKLTKQNFWARAFKAETSQLVYFLSIFSLISTMP